MLFIKYYLLAFVLVTSLDYISADLKADIQSFIPLLPQKRIAFVTAHHYISDVKFRKAWNYLRSDQFTMTWQSLLIVQEIKDLLAYIATSIDLTALLQDIPQKLRNYNLPMKLPPVEAMMQRNLATFLRDILRTLPRGAITLQITRKLSENGDFAKLYNALRNNEFKLLLEKARNAEGVKPALQEFQDNAIDIDEVIKTVFILLSWGP